MAEEDHNTSSSSSYDDDDVNSQVSIPDDATEPYIAIRLAAYDISVENARIAKETAKSRMDEASERADTRAYNTWEDEFHWERYVQGVFQRKIEATRRHLSRRQERSAATNGDTTHRSSDDEEGAAGDASTSATSTGERHGAGSVDEMMPESHAGDQRQRRSLSVMQSQVQASPHTQRSEELAISAHHGRQESVSDDSA